MSLSNVQIAAHCRRAGITTFRGVFSKDQLPAKRLPGFYVINLQSSDEGDRLGTHWTLLQVGKFNNWYFDSYGAPPPLEVRAFTVGPLYYSSAIVQSLSSSNCGRFVFDVMLQLYRGRSLESIVRAFSSNERNNDAVVVRAWKRD